MMRPVRSPAASLFAFLVLFSIFPALGWSKAGDVLSEQDLLTVIRQTVREVADLRAKKVLFVRSSPLLRPRQEFLGSRVSQYIKVFGKENLRNQLRIQSEEHSEIARLFHRGIGVPVDYKEALLWFQKASENGNTEASILVAGFQFLGRGCERDVTAAWKGAWTSFLHHPVSSLFFLLKLSDNISLYGFGTPLWLFFYVVVFWAVWIRKKRPGTFFQFIFPRNVYWSRQFWLEIRIQLFAVLGLIGFIVDSLFSVLLLNHILEAVKSLVSIRVDLMEVFAVAPGLGYVIYFLIIFLANDFFAYLAHYLNHRISFLWEFHKVHHATPTITPLTLYRMHPIDYLVQKIFIFTGSIFTGIFLAQGSADNTLFLQLTFFSYSLFVLNNLFNHSHLPLSLGFLNHVFVTPVMHHIHHSKASEHMDKNLGSLLTIFDRIFGTLHMPKNGENVEFGLDQESSEYDTLWKFYVLPFRRAFGVLREATSQWTSRRSSRLTV